MANAPTKGVDPYAIAGQLVGTFISIGFAKNNAKQQRELQEKNRTNVFGKSEADSGTISTGSN